jgi:carbonic anhydrase
MKREQSPEVEMKRNFLMLAAVMAMAVAMAQAASTTSTGWISDSMCGAKHMGTGADCVKKCIEGGQKPVFVDSSKTVWSIDNPDAVKADLYGAQVTVTATEDTANKSMHIESIVAAK